MKAFWWFKENAIAGMARPGFNSFHWFDLPFDEAVMLSWVGQYSTGALSLDEFRAHVKIYAPKIFKFYNLSETEGWKILEVLNQNSGVHSVLENLTKRTRILRDFAIHNNVLEISINVARLEEEIHFLKGHGFRHVVTLTEHHNGNELLRNHFTTHHLRIEDIGAPRREQVYHLAEVIKEARLRNEKVVVHCLAGIGRTSTVLLGAHMALGEDPAALRALIEKQNPHFVFTGAQGDFLQSFASK